MAKQTLTIDGITFPNFGKDKSKKNFRLIFIIAFKDANGEPKTLVLPTPAEGSWQWRNDEKDFFLPSTISGDSAVLDTKPLGSSENGFDGSAHKISEIDGKLSKISVTFVDVHDNTPLDLILGQFLPMVVAELNAAGIDPIDFIPVPGGPIIKGLIKQFVDTDVLTTILLTTLAKGSQDKDLHTMSKDYNNEKPFVLKEDNVPWGKDGKTGTYSVTIGFE